MNSLIKAYEDYVSYLEKGGTDKEEKILHRQKILTCFKLSKLIQPPLVIPGEAEAWEYAKEQGITALGRQGFMEGVKWCREQIEKNTKQ